MLLPQPANGAGNWLEQSVGSVTTVFHVDLHCLAEIHPKDSAMALNDVRPNLRLFGCMFCTPMDLIGPIGYLYIYIVIAMVLIFSCQF